MDGLSAKTVSQKLTALRNFFLWLITKEVITEKANPMMDIVNTRISSPLPEILFEDECRRLLAAASKDPKKIFVNFSVSGSMDKV